MDNPSRPTRVGLTNDQGIQRMREQRVDACEGIAEVNGFETCSANRVMLRARGTRGRQQAKTKDEGSHCVEQPPNAPRLSCAARGRGRIGMLAGAHQYVGAQMEFCQGRAPAASTAS